MRLTHPPTELLPTADPRRILRLPRPEVVRARPAGVHLPKQRDERSSIGLLCGSWVGRVVGCEGMEEGPCVVPQSINVGRAVGRRFGGCDGGRRRFGHGGIGGFAFAHGGP